MTRRNPSICLTPGCPNITDQTRCELHATPRERSRKKRPHRSSVDMGYDGSWKRARKRFLATHAPKDSQGRPICQACGTAITGPVHVDHIIPLKQGGTHDPSNLQALHRSCHGTKTAARDGGFGNPTRKRRK